MRKLRRSNGGQFVIIAAILIAVLTLLLALSVHNTYLYRQQLRYEPVEELVLGITSDLDRCLTHGLSIATHLYYGTDDQMAAENEGNKFVSKWVRSVSASYADLGINITLQNLQWDIEWSRNCGRSFVYTDIFLDIDAYGYKGWVGHSVKFVSLQILDVQANTVKFQIREGTFYESLPIPNLTFESIYDYKIHTSDYIWASDLEVEVTDLKYQGDGVYNLSFSHTINQYTRGVELTIRTPEDKILVSALNYKEVAFFVNLQSQKEDSPEPTNEGVIEFDDKPYNLSRTHEPFTLQVNVGWHSVKYFPEGEYNFKNWTISENVGFKNPNDHYLKFAWIEIKGNGTITAFYGFAPPTGGNVTIRLKSRQWNNSTVNLGRIRLNQTIYTLPNSTQVKLNDFYQIEYIPKNSSYEFCYWELEGVFVENRTSAYTTLSILGNGSATAVYKLAELKPTIPAEWDKLYLVKRAEDSLLLPYHMLPQQYFNPSSSTLPIPPRPADQGENLNVSSPPTPSITLARYVNVSIYIQLASYKADYLTLDLKFTYNGTAYEINSTTFKNVTGERWYTYSIDIENVDRSGWWWDPYSRTIPEGSIFTLSFILPPDSATGHIIYSWERYQSLIDLY